MDFKYSPMFQTLSNLDNVLGSNPTYTRRTEQLLACIALARLESAGRLRITFEELANQPGWESAGEAGLPPSGVSVLADLFRGWRQSSEALHMLKRLAQELKDAPASAWDVLPYVTTERQSRYSGVFFLAQPVVELMLDMLHGEKGAVWVPFDVGGQIAISAFRRGYPVNMASINGGEDLVAQLLVCIETAGVSHERLSIEIPRDATGRPTLTAEFVIAAPPFGSHSRATYWNQWASSMHLDPYDRAEAWAVAELLQRTQRRLVLISSHNWLFSTGQEKRLRVDLVDGPRPCLESVTALPPGVWTSSNIATAIACFDVRKESSYIRMSNLASDEKGRDLVDLIGAGRSLLLSEADEGKQSRMISVQEVREAEYVLLPQRLLNKATFGGSNTVPLGEICAAVRPATPYKGTDGETVLELGIPNLRNRKWKPLGDTYPDDPKTVKVKPRERDEVFLRQGDILLSVKGTLGLARLVSDVYGTAAKEGEGKTLAVLSTSCVALRFDRRSRVQGITPVYLLMYLRSAEGQEQIRSLQVGAAMPHISVQSLLNTLRIPVPPSDELTAVHADFEKLCVLETSIEDMEQEMSSIAESRWLVKLA